MASNTCLYHVFFPTKIRLTLVMPDVKGALKVSVPDALFVTSTCLEGIRNKAVLEGGSKTPGWEV